MSSVSSRPRLVAAGLLVSLVSVLSACGGDEEEPGAESGPTPFELREDEESRAIAVVDKHFRSIAEGDWSRVCNTLSEATQESVAAEADATCEAGAAERYGTRRFKRFATTFASITPEVTVDGDEASAVFEANFVVALVRNENGGWRLDDREAEPGPRTLPLGRTATELTSRDEPSRAEAHVVGLSSG